MVTGIEKMVCEDISARQVRGIAKYGMTVAENPLAFTEWLQHAYEETLDQAVYLKAAIEHHKKSLNIGSRTDIQPPET